ncbi:MAG: phage major capsid protein, partial [Tenuifilaceae bacterium]
MIKYSSKFGLTNIGLQYFAMRNADTVEADKAAIVARINEAVKNNDEKAFSEAFGEWTKMIEDAVMAEARGYADAHDQRVLAGRGVRQLTSEETKFYNAFIQAAKSDNPKMALTGFSEVLPKTVIDAVFEDIIENHPLLDAINFENSGALVEYLYSSMDGRFQAIWGKLCAEITKELSGSFHKITFGQNKLSAFLPMCKAMLDLGPEWLDRYLRAILYEAIANGLEDGIINGRGVAEGAADPDDYIYEPIGMIRDLTNFNVATGYAAKA